MLLVNALKSNQIINSFKRVIHYRAFTRCAHLYCPTSLACGATWPPTSCTVAKGLKIHTRCLSVDALQRDEMSDDEDDDDDAMKEVEEANIR